jgi:hypothetical protein
MLRPQSTTVLGFVVGLAMACVIVAANAAAQEDWRRSFDIDKKNLASVGRSPFVVLVPGFQIHLAEDDETVVISVLDKTEVVDGVETRVVEERETKGGEVVEVSRNFFAIDKSSGDVYYFGEDVDDYKDGKVVGHGGAWRSGVDGAKFGLIMPGNPHVGDKYYQEIAPKKAMDRAEVVTLDAELETPLRTFMKVLHTRETTPLNPREVSEKWYAEGIGMIGDEDLRIVKVVDPGAKSPQR